MVHSLIFCILSYSLYFLKFSTPSQNVEFHIHRGNMGIGLSKVIKFCTRKTINKIHFMSTCKMIIKCGDKLFPQKCELWVEVSPRIIRTRFQDALQLLIFEPPMKYCMTGKLNHTYIRTYLDTYIHRYIHRYIDT